MRINSWTALVKRKRIDSCQINDHFITGAGALILNHDLGIEAALELERRESPSSDMHCSIAWHETALRSLPSIRAREHEDDGGDDDDDRGEESRGVNHLVG